MRRVRRASRLGRANCQGGDGAAITNRFSGCAVNVGDEIVVLWGCEGVPLSVLGCGFDVSPANSCERSQEVKFRNI